MMPKFKPYMVTDAYPECGAFISDCDAIGGSKLKIGRAHPRAVPGTLAIVTTTFLNRSEIGFA